MKNWFPLCVLAAASALSPLALAADGHAAHPMTQAAAPQMSPMTEGRVKKVDRASGRLTLTHGPLVALGMPAMTMAFRVQDSASLKGLKEGDAVRFVAEESNGGLLITHLERSR